MLFCATRDNVRRLHATLQERGFARGGAVGRTFAAGTQPGACRRCATGVRGCAWPPMSPRAASICRRSAWCIHVEIPRDAQTLQHRSGRTGRAGKKGTAVLIVPYPRRKRVESMLRGAKIEADWIDAPTPEVDPGAGPRTAAHRADRSRRVRRGRSRAGAAPDGGTRSRTISPPRWCRRTVPPCRSRRDARQHARSTQGGQAGAPSSRVRGHRLVQMDVGRKQNADPRWILPLLCRRGHITRNEIGAIRIGQEETHFQVPRAVADKFTAALERTADFSGRGRLRHSYRSCTRRPAAAAASRRSAQRWSR